MKGVPSSPAQPRPRCPNSPHSPRSAPCPRSCANSPAWAAIKFLGIRLWVAVVIAQFGFYLAHTFLAPAIDTSTRNGVQIVNGKHT